MVTPGAPDFSGLDGWGPPALGAVLTALADALGADAVEFVPVDHGGPVMRSRSARRAAAVTIAAVDEAASQWLADARPGTVRLRSADDQLVDIAGVHSASGSLRGALIVAGADLDSTGASRALETAAALICALLDTPPSVAARQALLDWATAQRGGRSAYAVSIDRLGAANQVLGFPAGDVLLRTLLDRIAAWAGPDGRVAGTGGARYVVMRTDVHDEGAALREADRLRGLVAEPVEVDGLPVSLSASIGVAVDGRGSTRPDLLVANAIRSGVGARTAGGDRSELFDDAVASAMLDRLRLGVELYGALIGGQLRMHYQPEFDLVTGGIVAVEALLRWQHPQLGLLGAESFVPEAEQTHTFLAVQRWVIDESCRQLAEWRASGTADALVLRLNVPGTLAAHGEITRTLLHAIDRYQVPAARICVELTERSMPDDVAPLAAELAGWRELGMTVAIDDFGIGHATLTHLVTLPLDVIKIDQSFVARLAVDERAAAVVAGVIGLARSLGLDVVAEGINGTSTSTELVRLGCTRGQGNALAPAMEPEQIESLLPYQR